MGDLQLRNFRDSDFKSFHSAMSNFDVVKMTASWPWPPEQTFTKSRMNAPMAKSGQVNVIALNDQYVGQVSVVNGELGYMLAKRYWGRGVVSWAVKTKLNKVFRETDIQVLSAGVWEGNPASERVLEKFEFVKTGSSRDYCKPQGKVLNGYDFKLNRADWVATQPLNLETDRLCILPFEGSDAPALAELMNNIDIARMMQSIPRPFSVAQARDWIAARPFDRRAHGFCAKITLKDGTLIGFLGLGGDPVNTAYALGQGYWGKGYATEAMQAFLADSIAVHNLDEITAGAFVDNPASQRVLEKLGFTREGEKPHKTPGRVEEALLILYRLRSAKFGTR